MLLISLYKLAKKNGECRKLRKKSLQKIFPMRACFTPSSVAIFCTPIFFYFLDLPSSMVVISCKYSRLPVFAGSIISKHSTIKVFDFGSDVALAIIYFVSVLKCLYIIRKTMYQNI